MSALAPLFAFPVVVWTVFVAISLVYWLFVMSGLVHLGEGVDGGAEGLGEGLGEGIGGGVGDGATGAIKGALEGAAGGGGPDVELHADADGDLDLDGDVDAGHAEAHGAGPHALLAAFRMRDVPVTVQFTLISFFAWVASFVALWALGRTGHDPSLLVRCLVTFLAAPAVALPLAKLAARPLAPLLVTKHAKSARDLIGKTCTIRTGEATETFGEAVVKDTGADLVLRVRVEGSALRRGEEGLIVGWDEEREEYIVESMDEAMGRPKKRG